MLTLKDMMAAGMAAVEKIDAARARQLVADGALLLDIRDGVELARTGTAAGAVHVSRGLLEFAADPESPAHNPEFRRDRPVVMFCASGGRVFLAGKLLKDMGYEQVYNLGGLKDWVEGGGAAA
ncbi:MAG: rhodanese-like domain-containing protein [Pseudomonadota bacterium]